MKVFLKWLTQVMCAVFMAFLWLIVSSNVFEQVFHGLKMNWAGIFCPAAAACGAYFGWQVGGNACGNAWTMGKTVREWAVVAGALLGVAVACSFIDHRGSPPSGAPIPNVDLFQSHDRLEAQRPQLRWFYTPASHR